MPEIAAEARRNLSRLTDDELKLRLALSVITSRIENLEREVAVLKTAMHEKTS